MNHTYFFISDTELGRGDITDDFRDDKGMVTFLEYLGQEHSGKKVTLILNGDTFDFMKMAYQDDYPLHITEEISLWKLRQIPKAHPEVFDALKKFMQNPNHAIYFVIGNHDFDLIWPSVQEEIRQLLGNTDRVAFGFQFQNDEIHAEHGHLEDPLFEHDFKKPFMEIKGETVLNLPWGSWACSNHLVKIKHEFPEEERMYPKPLLFKSHQAFRKKSIRATLKLIFLSFLKKLTTQRKHRIYLFPFKRLVSHAFKYQFDFLDDEKFLPERMTRIAAKHPEKRYIVMGHAHVLKEYSMGENQKILITDTWRHEKDIRDGSIKKKSYAEIHYENGELVSACIKTIE